MTKRTLQKAETRQPSPYSGSSAQMPVVPAWERLTLDVVREQICADATANEIKFFIHFCQYKKLNPFAKEVYLIKPGSQPAYVVIDVIKAVEPCLKHPDFDFFKAGIIVINADKKYEEREGEFQLQNETLLGAWCVIYDKGGREFKVSIALKDWIKIKNDGKPMALWATNPAGQIYKTAIKRAFRYRFPGVDQNTEFEDVEVKDGEDYIDTEEASRQEAIKAPEAGNDPPEAKIVQPEPPPEASEGKGGDLKTLLDERRRKLFGYMRDTHGYSESEKIRDRILLVLGGENRFSSVNDFIMDDAAYFMFFEKDAATPKEGEDPAGEIYGTDPEDFKQNPQSQKKGEFKLK